MKKKSIMLSGVALYLNESLQNYLYEDLIEYCPNLCYHKKNRLRLMIRKVGSHFLAGKLRDALIQYRACIILIMQSSQHPETIDILRNITLRINCGKFMEPCDPNEKCILSSEETDYILAQLINRFKATSNQISFLSIEHKAALYQGLEYHMRNSGAVCPISLEPIFQDEKLTDDIGVLFEEEEVELEVMAKHNIFLNARESSFIICNSDMNNIDNICDGKIMIQPTCPSIGFATQLLDLLFVKTCRVAQNCLRIRLIDDSRTITPSNRLNLSLGELCSEQTSPLLEQVTSSSSLSVLNAEESSEENVRHMISRRWTITSSNTEFTCTNQTKTRKSSCVNDGSTNVFRVVRCHFFKATQLLKWFDTGQWINPVTRNPILPDDWCRLTCPFIETVTKN
ncbi:uncharacterized protein LOC128883311 isoform X2 [Hylaeus volcanicus]|uniref:uncharacterized protein LOC128883311 isoform X2 n=1 Tax=Hylaeus volcanicus TaxID=313075 RepID=UPI0023B7A2A7|nr:uncharacterized protein LOC128883311 isoform X2 [Hylaeus volcanicus]